MHRFVDENITKLDIIYRVILGKRVKSKDGIRLSVITVCRNAQSTISNTIKSVLMQECDEYEYIIIDGKSEDNTLNIISDYTKLFCDKGIKYYCISETDNGIYDAMNKGINLAKGEYICFLNADDSFYTKDVLSYVCHYIMKSFAEIYYGNAYLNFGCNEGYTQIPKSLYPHILGRMPFIHQASFVKTDLLREYNFNTEYKISADYDFYYKMFLKNKSFYYLDKTIANYSMLGVSNREQGVSNKEYRIIKNNNNIDYHATYKIRCIGWLISAYYCFRDCVKKNKLVRKIFFDYMRRK